MIEVQKLDNEIGFRVGGELLKQLRQLLPVTSLNRELEKASF